MKILYFLIIYLVCSTLQTYCINNPDSLFKVTRIKSKGDYYIIYAKRNDSLFKIISKKVSVSYHNLELLKKGEYYYFDFKFDEKKKDNKVEPEPEIVNNLEIKKTDYSVNFHKKKLSEEKVEPLDGRINNKNKYFYDGNTKIRLTKRFHYGLYSTINLIGLYYVPPECVQSLKR
jgi:hypothetical protein